MKTVLITGASAGFGHAIAERFLAEGARAVVCARRLDPLQELSARFPGQVSALALDVTDRAAIAAALGSLPAGFDAIDVLVNNAGLALGLGPAHEADLDDWERMIATNCSGLVNVTRAVLPGMMDRGTGHVCTIGSISGRSAFVGGTCYAATKAFVTAWAESLLMETRERGVKVSVVSPGAVATMFGGRVPTAADAWKLHASDVADAVSYVVGTPESVLVHRVEVRTLSAPPSKKV